MLIGLGHPRCGTAFTSSLLRKAGMGVGHEWIGRDGMVSWMALSGRESVPWGHAVGPVAGHRLFCVTRAPLSAIELIMPENNNRRSLGWRAGVIWEKLGIDLFCAAELPQTDLGFAVASYACWYRVVLDLAPEMVFRVDRPEDDAKLAAFVGRPIDRSTVQDRNSRAGIRGRWRPEDLAEFPRPILYLLIDVAEALGYPEDAARIAAQIGRP